MQYVSTRGLAPALGFRDVLMAGLARDGGLYVPAAWPRFSGEQIAALAGKPYPEVAFEIVRPFVGGEIADGRLADMCRRAYAGFRHPAVAPLTRLAQDRYVLELFHGPTLAFKDVAMQLLAQLMEHVLAERREAVTIVGATSGDTGAAAVEAFLNHDRVDVFILFPEGRISPIQRRQMTTSGAGNVHPVAIKGTFDDCQAILKALFADEGFRDRVSLTGVNSINWGRVLGQVVYYFTAAAALGAPDRTVSFTVPTGNFGDIFAGYVAKRMGLPIETLVIAANVNDILPRAIATGRYEVRRVTATSSPSMDIQVSSNFERLLFEAYGRDAGAIRALMKDLAEKGSFDIGSEALAAIRADFAAGSADEAETAATIKHTYAETGFLPDPHTSVGLAVAKRFAKPGIPMVTLATAHPAKFPETINAATGIEPELPPGLGVILRRDERFDTLPADRWAVADFIAARSRAAKLAVGVGR
jgi:threonine synthase